ncbi:ATP-binding transmembrane ABC transporter [Legionella santicrucis]|uniref:ATP-binding transmembrane ABC transporter n=1 Tax=Legionella santicrucis TaxID=45074 RepID=A0A0W0YIV8_9GAMM|nr:ABC transporter ATP-binding protein/permease [Legionella santicrucis]KTD56763.1 ATP-binding transmembrane ABC transporter [Legionella santicrucis]
MQFTQRLKAALKLSPYLWPKDRKIRLRLMVSILLLLTTIALNIGVPLIFRQVIDVISSPSSIKLLAVVLMLAYGFAWTFSRAMNQLCMIPLNRVIERGMRLLCLSVFDHLMGLSLRYHSSRKTGEILSVIDRAQFAFWPFFCGLFFLILPTLIEMIIAASILTYLYGFAYGIILIFILGTYMIFSVYGSQWSAQIQEVANEKSSQVSSVLVDSLLNYEVVRSFGTREYEYRRCDAFLAERENAATKQHNSAQWIHLGQGIVMGVGLIILTILSGSGVMAGTLKISDFVLINVYLLQFMVPLGNFGYVLRDINEGLTNFVEVGKILEEEPEVQDAHDAVPLILTSGMVTFDNVHFAYDSRRNILQHVSFNIPAKKTIAIVGPTGAGKSTISKLLFRYYDLSGGRILIDGQDISHVTQTSLQSAIGIVPQHTTLFNDTLYYNIAYGHLDATENDIQQAIKLSHLDEFIACLPDGLNTMVGEHGLKLSGGERQRVAIARVLLKKPAILIFDEATASLDTKTEQLIQKNIEEISHDSTTLIIAHRLSTVVHADEIIVLDHGVVAEKGTHGQLLKQGGLYSQLWKKQIHENLEKEE